MISRSIRWQLAVSYAAIALLAALALGGVLLSILRGYYAQRELDYLTTNAQTIEEFVSESGALSVTSAKLQSLMQSFAFLAQARVRVTDANGATLADTGPVDAGQTVALSSLPLPGSMITSSLEISKAVVVVRSLPGGSVGYQTFNVGSAVTKPVSPTGKVQIRAVARELPVEAAVAGQRSSQVVRVPITDASGKVQGQVEVSQGPAYGSEILASVARGWAIAGAAAVVLATMVGWLASRRISAPVLALAATTERMAAGDLAARAPADRRDELGHLADSFNEMASQIESTIVALRRFVSDAAHEIHTPLTALRTNLEVASAESDEAGRRVLERAQLQVERLQRLADGLLELSRVEAGAGREDFILLDLATMMQEMVEAQASCAEQAGLAFVLQVPEAAVTVRGREDRLRGMLDNLVDNAIKFTPAGGSIEVGVRQDGAWAEMWVADTGIGIPADDLPQLFSRFHRGRNAAAYPGNGLGLAIVRAIAESHGGQATAESRGCGVRFVIRLPACEPISFV